MKTSIHRLICIVIAIGMCISMSACSTNVSSDGSELNEKDVYNSAQGNDSDYTLVRDNGKFLIAFDDLGTYQVDHQDIVETVEFATMKEFKDRVTKGLLTDSEKRMMATFEKDSAGAILTCDFNNLYAPKLPNGGAVNRISWRGQSYLFDLAWEDGVFGWLTYLTESQYNSRYQEDYLNFFDRDTITVTKRESPGDGKMAFYYTTHTGQLMNLRYSLTDGEKTIVVDKTFRLRMDYIDLPTSSTVPSEIVLYGTSEEGYWYIVLYGFTEDPTDEWLTSFGLQKYVDNG